MPWGLPTPSLQNERRSDRQDSSNTTESLLDKELQSAVPACARICLDNFIRTQFNLRCLAADCICSFTSNSEPEYSLGELALKCVKGPSCDGVEITEKAAAVAFNLCSGRYGAAPGVLSTLTVVPSTSTTRTSSATSTATKTSSVVRTSTTPAATTSSSSAATAGAFASSRPEDDSGLSSGQAVGIAIGAVSAVTLIAALIYVISCMRRRKRQKNSTQRHSWDFADEEPANHSQFVHGNVDTNNSSHGWNAYTAGNVSEKHHTFWPSPYAGHGTIAERQYGHKESKMSRTTNALPDSPGSNTSMRTLSQLLPERPGRQPPPPPSKSPAYAPAIYTPATVFEEEHTPKLPDVSFPGLPAHPAVMKNKAVRATHVGMAQPALSIQIPQQPVRTPDTHNSVNWPLPPPPALQPHGELQRLGTNSGAFSSKTSLLDYYASADSGASPQDLNSSTPIEEAMQVRRPAPAAIVITQPSYQPQAVRDSIASDISRRTSFESTNPDDTTPPEDEDKRLSPVVESPISNVRYPRIPRPSNQAIPRSPVYSGAPVRHPQRTDSRADPTTEVKKTTGHAPTLSGSTLAAKRRGDTAAHNLEQGLHISNSSYDTTSRKNATRAPSENRAHRGQQNPLKGYGRPTNPPSAGKNQSATVQVKSPADSLGSPLWEPKMTPSRKGDDLFLSVSVATPQASHFHELYDRR